MLAIDFIIRAPATIMKGRTPVKTKLNCQHLIYAYKKPNKLVVVVAMSIKNFWPIAPSICEMLVATSVASLLTSFESYQATYWSNKVL